MAETTIRLEGTIHIPGLPADLSTTEFLKRFVASAWELEAGPNLRVFVVELPKSQDDALRAALSELAIDGTWHGFDTAAHHQEMVRSVLMGAAKLATDNIHDE